MASSKNTQRNFNRGFTLIELLVVVAILGILAVVLVPTYIQYVEKSREAVCRSNRSELLHAYQVEDVMIRVNGGEGAEVPSLADFVAHHGPGCPSNGVYSVKDGAQEVFCSLHDGGEVPGETPTESPEPTETPGDSTGGRYYQNGSTSDSYEPGDIIQQGNTFYRCISKTTNEPKNNNQDYNWQKIVTTGAHTYNVTNTYVFGAVVENEKGKHYICIDAEKAKTIRPPMDNSGNSNEAWKKIQ